MGTVLGESSIVAEPLEMAWLRERASQRIPRLYAIMDACDEPLVPQRAFANPDTAVSLYRGYAEQDYWAIAPYLFEVDDTLLDWIVANLWERPWGVFVLSEMDLASVRRHLRRFLMVEGPDGGRLYFRFYDPRVLRSIAPTWTKLEAEEFFGPIEQFVFSTGPRIWSIGVERDSRTNGRHGGLLS